MRPFLLIATRADNVVADAEYEQFLRFGHLTESELRRIRLEAGPLPELSLGDYSGIIIAGSPFTGSDPIESKSETQLRVELEMSNLLNQVVADDVPFLGACYGVGTLALHQGGIVDGTYAEEPAAITITLTAAGRSDPILTGIPATFTSIVGHKEAVTTLPSSASVLATGAACPVQMFKVKNNIYATQFHPELDPPGLAARLRHYKDAGYIDPTEVEPVISRINHADVAASHLVIKNFVDRYAR